MLKDVEPVVNLCLQTWHSFSLFNFSNQEKAVEMFAARKLRYSLHHLVVQTGITQKYSLALFQPNSVSVKHKQHKF